jgi:hypothetical protein
MITRSILHFARRFAQTLALLGLVVLANFGHPRITPAQPSLPVWSSPILLSTVGQNSWFPEVLADPTGLVHVVWSATTSIGPREVYDSVLYRASRDGVDWTQTIDIAAILTKGAVTRPSILIDQTGLFHMTYRSYTIYYTHALASDVRANAMLPAREISSPDVGYFSRMAEDSQGRLHLLYSENAFLLGCTGCFHVYYRWSDDSGLTWSDPIDITRQLTGAAKPQIIIDDQDNLHVVWEVGRGGDLGQVPNPATVAYAASYDRGVTWSQPYDFVPPEGEGRNIAIGLDRQGQLVVAWLSALPENDVVYYNLSSDRGRIWSEPQLIPGTWGAWANYQGKTDTYMMTNDSAGNLYLVLSGRTEPEAKSLGVLCLIWDGKTWSEPQSIITITGDVPEWPRLSIGNGNQLNLVWFVRNKAGVFDADRSQYTVWYARGVSSAPALPTIVWPTRAPTSTPTLALAATPSGPTRTPTPTRVPVTPAPPIEIYRESDYLLIAAQSVLPVAALVALVFIFKRLRR